MRIAPLSNTSPAFLTDISEFIFVSSGGIPVYFFLKINLLLFYKASSAQSKRK